MEHNKSNEIEIAAGLVAGAGLQAGMQRSTKYQIECVRDGVVIWTEEFENLVVNEGLNDSLDKHFKGSSYSAAWYVGLTGATPSFAAGDVMTNHSGWTYRVREELTTVGEWDSSVDLGFANTVTPSDTDPFNSGEKIRYTAQDFLLEGEYFWRARVMDPAGTGQWSDWTDDRSIIIRVQER